MKKALIAGVGSLSVALAVTAGVAALSTSNHSVPSMTLSAAANTDNPQTITFAAPFHTSVLGNITDVGETQTLPIHAIGQSGDTTGKRVFWLGQSPFDAKVTTLSWGIATSSSTLPNQGMDLDSNVASPGIHDYREVDNGDAVAVVSGAGTVTSTLTRNIRSYDMGYQGLHLIVVPGNNGATSVLNYIPAVGETVASTDKTATVVIQ